MLFLFTNDAAKKRKGGHSFAPQPRSLQLSVAFFVCLFKTNYVIKFSKLNKSSDRGLCGSAGIKRVLFSGD